MPVPSAVIMVLISSEDEHLVEAGLLDVEDLPLERQDGLELPVAPLLGRAAGGIALDQEELGLLGVALRAVGELAGEVRGVERALAPRQVARLARRLAGVRRLDALLDDPPRLARVLLQVGAEPLDDHLLDPTLDVGGDQLVLGLRGELGVLDACTEITAVSPSRMSSPVRFSLSVLDRPPTSRRR